MRRIARIITRPNGENQEPDIIIGVCSKNSGLEGNKVYELQEINGEVVFKEIGESWMTINYNPETGTDGWSSDIGSIMRNIGNKLLLSKEEYMKLKDEE